MTLFPELPQSRKPRTDARLFFALWPDPATRSALAAAAGLIPPGQASRASWVKPDRYHLTLCFFGSLNVEQVEAAKRAAATVVADAFELELDEVGHFPGVRVAWIGPRELPAGLSRLKAALDGQLMSYGLPVEAGSYRPHVTCVRGLPDAPDAPSPAVLWPVNEFVLVRSILKPGSTTYKLLARWPLRTPRGPR